MEELKTPEIGQQAPDFTSVDEQGNSVHLYDLLAQGLKVLLIFYPGDDTPGCTKQLCAVRDVYGEYESLGVKVLGINHASAKSHQKFIDKYSLPFDIVVDEGKKIVDIYGAHGSFMGHPTIKRTVYLIDTDGKILDKVWGQQDNEAIISKLKNKQYT
jgi:peroxiredoxin Q/BCP